MFLLAAVLIVAIICVVVIYAIKHLSSAPVRIAAVIAAIATLVGVFPRVIDSLRPAPAPAGVPAEAPSPSPAATTSPSAVRSGPADIPLVAMTGRSIS
ncbi:hypothetical protein OG345_41635 (plasmid) [Streptomyces sp. NBC_01220]|uniref:hypothetical protein n=1 Tax=Streptomyces sp. NBC_01220 TaxID=2903781 RepID=UPI00352D34BC|nr:hypothetical protein OG345_41635 [Streptomyces sp. NBC_01220]